MDGTGAGSLGAHSSLPPQPQQRFARRYFTHSGNFTHSGTLSGHSEAQALCVNLLLNILCLPGFNLGQILYQESSQTASIGTSAAPSTRFPGLVEPVFLCEYSCSVSGVLCAVLSRAYRMFWAWLSPAEWCHGQAVAQDLPTSPVTALTVTVGSGRIVPATINKGHHSAECLRSIPNIKNRSF